MSKGNPGGPSGANGADQGQKKRGRKKILLFAFLALLVAGGGLAGYVLMAEEPGAGTEAQASQAPARHRVTMPLEPFLVNLADKESRRYLKLKVELEVENDSAAKELEKSVPRLRDAVILLLSSKTYLDLASVEGKQRLKEEIRQRIRALPGGSRVNDVFFTEFVAQ